MMDLIKAILDAKDHPEYRFDTYDWIKSVLCVIIIIVNLIVVLSSGLLLHRGQQPRSTYIFLGNISLSDMILGAVTLFLLFFRHQLYSETACTIFMSCETIASLVSIFSIGLIGIDRYLYILYGLYYTRYITSNRSHCMVFATWLLGGVFGFTAVFVVRNSNSDETIPCSDALAVPPKIALLLVSVGLLPMLLVLVLYTIILKNALTTISNRKHCTPRRKTEPNMQREQSSPTGTSTIDQDNDDSFTKILFCLLCCKSLRTNSNMEVPLQCIESKWKAVKVVVFITGAFLITWLPFIVTYAIHGFCDYHLHPQDCIHLKYLIHKPLGLLCLSNSLLNPIIYAWWHNGFRESMKKLCRKFFVQRC